MIYTLDIHFSCLVCPTFLGADHQFSASFKSFSNCNMCMFNKTSTLQEVIFLYVYTLGSCCFLCKVYMIALTFLYAVRSLLSPKFMNLWTNFVHILIVVLVLYWPLQIVCVNCCMTNCPVVCYTLCISPYSVGYNSSLWYIYNDVNWRWAYVNAW